MEFDFFRIDIDYTKYFGDQLILSSTLLGLLLATSIFLLQSGFASFSFSRTMFLKYYVRLTKFLFLLLGYNIIASSIFLYTHFNAYITFGIHLLFSVAFVKYLLDFYSHKGYILTVFSNKSNPFKTRFRRYFRYIFNLGILSILSIFLLISIVTIYPLLLDNLGEFTERQGFISTLVSFALCVIFLIRIIPQYFSFSEQEYKQKENNELSEQIAPDLTQELLILKDTLVKNGRAELKEKTEFQKLNGQIHCRLCEQKDEAFFVVNIWIKTTDLVEIVRSIERYTYDFFQDLIGTSVDINSFVLSLNIQFEGENSFRQYFVRAKRVELENAFSKTSNPELFIKNLRNKVVDELFRNI